MRPYGAKVNRRRSNPLPLENGPAGKTEPSSKSSADKLAAHLNKLVRQAQTSSKSSANKLGAHLNSSTTMGAS